METLNNAPAKREPIKVYDRQSATAIVRHLMRTECYDKEEALAVFQELRDEVAAGADPEDLLYEIGLEPDYVFGLI